MTGFVRQFELAWALADLHLTALTGDDFLWEPGPVVWTMHRDASGRWRPDWAESEPDPVPVPTIGWLTWHIMWWWSAAAGAVTGGPIPAPASIAWPGGAGAVAQIRDHAARWRAVLSALGPAELVHPSAFPWGPSAARTVEDTVLWLNVELTKNAAEIGQLRLLRGAAQPD